MKLTRLFEIIYILLDKKTVTASQLAEKFEVSTRTIYRDIDTLSACGIPIFTNKGKGGGISILEGFTLDKAMLTKGEQSDIISALQSQKAIGVKYDHSALSKLSSFFKSEQTDWIEIDFTNWNSGKEDKEKFELIKQCIINRNKMFISYSNLNSESNFRTINPLKLIYKNSWYLYAFCLMRNDYRIFKLTRISDFNKLDENFVSEKNVPPPTLSYEEKISVPTKQVTLRFDASVAYRVYDDFKQSSIETSDDGSLCVTINEYNEHWLLAFIQSHHDHVECLEPAELREKIKTILQKSLEKYL